jgi:hypothetical protein
LDWEQLFASARREAQFDSGFTTRGRIGLGNMLFNLAFKAG